MPSPWGRVCIGDAGVLLIIWASLLFARVSQYVPCAWGRPSGCKLLVEVSASRGMFPFPTNLVLFQESGKNISSSLLSSTICCGYRNVPRGCTLLGTGIQQKTSYKKKCLLYIVQNLFSVPKPASLTASLSWVAPNLWVVRVTEIHNCVTPNCPLGMATRVWKQAACFGPWA